MNTVTFVVPVRNRSAHLVRALRHIEETKISRLFDFVVVQDWDRDNITLDNCGVSLDYFGSLRVINVKTWGDNFNKSLLTNYGLRRVRTPCVVILDADVLVGRDVLLSILELSAQPNFLSGHFVKYPCVELEESKEPDNTGVVPKRGHEISTLGLYLIGRLNNIGAFNERIPLYGETTDLNRRYCARYNLLDYNLGFSGLKVFHVTHENKLRSPIFRDRDTILEHMSLSRASVESGQFSVNVGKNWGVMPSKEEVSLSC